MRLRCIIIAAIILLPASLFAADLHVGAGQTYTTIAAAAAAASKGDVVIIHDGTYNESFTSWPVGTAWTAGNYTTIKALNDGGVTITGSLYLVNTSAYLSIEGLKFSYTSTKNIEGTNLKFFRCSFQNGGASDYGTNISLGTNDYPNATSYALFEDCWFYGSGGRYNLQVYLADHIVIRRCVFRHDGGYGPYSGNPEACLAIYNSQYIEIQNCIAIDSDLDTYVYYGQSYYFIYNSASAETCGPIYVRGCIALNTKAVGYRSDSAGSSTISIPTFTDSVAYAFETYGWANGSSNLTLSVTATQSAFGSGQYGFGDWGPGSPSVTNSYVFSISSTVYDGWSNSGNDTTPGTDYLYLPRIESGTVGPTITKKIGTSGTLYGDSGYATTTADDLWPWPNEDRIKTDMAAVSTRGFATSSNDAWGQPQTLTRYIWQYLGNQIPADIYTDATPPTISTAAVTGSAVSITTDETTVWTGYDANDCNLDCSVTGTDIGLTSPSGSGTAWTLTAASAIQYGETCNLDCTLGTDDIEDTSGNDMVTFADTNVTNNTSAPAAARTADGIVPAGLRINQ